MVLWGESFWGDGNRGFEILSSNVKNGAIAIEEFQRFITESVQCESTYCKSLSRLQSQLLKTQHVGTFTPIWTLIRDLLDKTSAAHLVTVNFYQELLRDVHNYQELHQKKFKTHIQKDADIMRSTDLMSQLTNALNTVNKAKEQYHSIAFDYERAKRAGNSTTNSGSMSTSQENNSHSLAQTAINSLTSRHLERLEKKYRQAQDEYKLTVEKYNSVRNEYEKRFYDVCTKFQGFEIDHIEKMLIYAMNYSEILQRNREQITVAQNEFHEKLKSLTGTELLDTFVEQKKVGTEPPAALQFEDIDNLKTTMQLTNTDVSNSQDDFNLFDPLESNVPSFQAHFSVTSPVPKFNDSARALSPNAPSSQPQSSLANAMTTPSSSTNTTSANPTSSNNSVTRAQEPNSNNDQTSNPFDFKIRKPKFPGFFGSGRREKKEKKLEKNSSLNSRLPRAFKSQPSSDEPVAGNLRGSNQEVNDFNLLTDQNNDFPSNINKHKHSSSESHVQSNLFSSTTDSNPQNTNLPSKSSSSSDSSDDDDDNLMTKINVKINPKSQVSLDVADDDAKLMNAMRLIDKNIGNLTTTSRAASRNAFDVNQSVSNEQLEKRKLPPPPPPLPSRPATTVLNNVITDSFAQTNMFPPHNEFDRSPTTKMNISSPNQDNPSIPSRSTTESKNSTSVSSTDDDTEVANSFPGDYSINKSTAFPVLQAPSFHQSNKQQSISPAVSQIMAPVNISFRNSPITSNEQGMSPLTIGATDQIPLAIAFQETIHVMMSGNNRENWKSRIAGEMLISFPASMLSLLNDSVRFGNILEFQIKNPNNLENIIVKSPSITQNEAAYSFDMTELKNILRNQHEKTPSSRFFNLNVLTYEVKNSDLSHLPVEISSQWTRTFDTISVNISYHFNSSLLPESVRMNNDSIVLYTIITDGQQIKESSPSAEWSVNEHKLWWKVPYVNNGTGSLSATVGTVQANTTENDDDQSEQPLTTSSIINAYFIGENALFSTVEFDLACRGYRISLLRKKILSGKYQSEPDQSEPIHLFQRPTTSPSSAD